MLQTIFEKFYRVDNSRSTGTGGAGLGLAIAKEIVELHDGQIMAKSDDLHTRFIVMLPSENELEENEEGSKNEIHTHRRHTFGADRTLKLPKEKREKEIWSSLERVLEVCESKHVEMLLIAGDLFHRQPLRRELKELDYLFSKLTMTEVVIIAGNHDYLKRDSYYRTFQWPQNVHMILDREIQCVEFPAYSLAIYGMSYDTKQITEECYCDAFAQRRQHMRFCLRTEEMTAIFR